MDTRPAPAPHPLNGSFTWADHEGPYRVLTEDQVARFDQVGCVVLERVIPPEVVARVVAAIDPFEEELEALLRGAGGTIFIARADEITFTTHLVQRSALLRSFAAAPLFRDICADLIGPDVRLYWDQAVYKKAGTEAPFPWHQDNGYAFVEPQAYLTCWVALTDATRDNGCPLVVPGVHRSGTLEHRVSDIGLVCLDDPRETVVAEAPAGSVVVFSSLTPHCTGSNRTDATRKSYILQYAPDGAAVQHADDRGGVTAIPANDPDRQFPVLVAGAPGPGAPSTWP